MTIITPAVIRKRLRSYLTGKRPDGTKITIPEDEKLKGIRTAILSHMSENLKLVHTTEDGEKTDLTNERRHLVYGFIFGLDNVPIREWSTNDLSPLMLIALHSWIGAEKTTENGKERWIPREGWTVEVNEIANLATSWFYHPELSKRNLGKLVEEWETANPTPTRPHDELDQVSTAVMLGGVPAELPNPKVSGIVIPIPDYLQNLDSDMYWCDWCGDRPASPGVPCESCRSLGAQPKPEPRYTDVETGKTVAPAPPLQKTEEPAKQDLRPAWMRSLKTN